MLFQHICHVNFPSNSRMENIGVNRVDADTHQIVNDYLTHHLSRRGFQWECIPPLRQPDGVNLSLRTLGDQFENLYHDQFHVMREQLSLTPGSVSQPFLQIVNELFREGITWSRIVSFFVFSGEICVYLMDQSWQVSATEVSNLMKDYISRELHHWILDHGGWNGLVAFSEGKNDPTESPWPKFKNFVCGVAAAGVLTVGAFLASKS